MPSTYRLHTLNVACLGLIVSSIACSVGSPGSGTTPTATLGPGGGSSSSSPVPPTTAALAGPGEVVVTGDLNVRFQPANVNAAPLVDQVSIALYQEDQVSGVFLFLPYDLVPGTYPIGDLFHLAETNVTARLDQVDFAAGSSFWESIDGTLVLTETGSSYSGSFSFTAVSTPEGSRSVTVTGNFDSVPLNQ